MNSRLRSETTLNIRQAGLSLVELMISLTIGFILVAGISSLIAKQSSTREEQEKSSRQIENGRYAMQLLHDDIEHAGFYGDYSPPSASLYSTPDPCDITDDTADLGSTGNLGWINNSLSSPTIPVAIYGYAGSDATPACVTDRKAGTAILVVRRTTASDPILASAAIAGTTYMQVSSCSNESTPFVLGTSGFTLHQKDCTTAPPGTLATIRQYVVRIYYVSTCDVCGTDTIPTLKMVQFMAGAQTVSPLVEGIENLQFDYGIDNTNDGSPDTYSATPTATDWKNVMSVRASLLSRNNEITVGYTDTKSYTLGSVAIPAAYDHYKRHSYSELVRAVNPSSRREAP